MTRRGNEELMCISGKALPPRTPLSALFACWLMAAGLLITGCTGGASNKSKVSNTANGSSADGQQAGTSTQADQNSVLLENVRHSLDLTKLGTSTDLPFVVSMLNQWHDSMGDKANTKVEIPPSVLSQIRPEHITELNNPIYTPADGIYLRDCVTARAITAYALGNARSDLARAVKLFQYAVRAIRLTPNHNGWISLGSDQKIDLPLTLYDLCLLGCGTAQDRAWLFSSLLRQLGIDSVVIIPETPSGQSHSMPGSMLVGVVLGKNVYLFDPQNGIPIPAPIGTVSTPENPAVATFEQAVTHPELFRQLDPVPKVAIYAVQGENLRKSKVFLIGSSPMWSAKAKRLQTQFSGTNSLNISVALADSDGQPGMLNRVGNAGGKYWNADSLKLWPYPQIQMVSSLQLDPNMQSLLGQLKLPLQAPFLWEFNQQKQRIEIVKPKKPAQEARGWRAPVLQDARLAHLNGEFDAALKIYNDVRIEARNHPYLKHPPQNDSAPPVIQESGEDATAQINIGFVRSGDDATYFTGMCQFDQGNYRAASETLRKYLMVFAREREQLENMVQQDARQKGMLKPDVATQRKLVQTLTTHYFWVNSARWTLALAEGELGRKADAARILRAIPANSPQFVGTLHLMRQYDAAVATEVQQDLLKQFNEFRARQEAEAGIVPGGLTPSGTPASPPEKSASPPAVKPDEKPPSVPGSAPAKVPENPATTPTKTATPPAKTKDEKSSPTKPETPATKPTSIKPATKSNDEKGPKSEPPAKPSNVPVTKEPSVKQ